MIFLTKSYSVYAFLEFIHLFGFYFYNTKIMKLNDISDKKLQCICFP